MLPSFRSLVTALKLMIPTYVGLILFAFYFWLFLITALILLAVTLNAETLILALFGILLLISGLIFYAIQLGVWSLVLKLLWSKPPQFLKVKWSRFWIDFSISVMAALPIASIFILKIGYQSALKTFFGYEPIDSAYALGTDRTIPDLLIQFAWLWFIFAAYLIQWQQPKKQ